MDKKAKILMSLALIASIGCVSGVAYAAYSVSSDGASTILPISVSKIEINNFEQNTISFNKVGCKNITYAHQDGIINNDVLSLAFKFNTANFRQSATLEGRNMSYTLMHINATIPNVDLFNYAKDKLLTDGDLIFLNSKFGSKTNELTLDNTKPSKYYANVAKSVVKDCYAILGNTINIIIPILPDYCASGNLSIKGVDPDRSNPNSIWDFNINFDFDFVDDEKGYGMLFNKTHFEGMEFALSMEYFG